MRNYIRNIASIALLSLIAFSCTHKEVVDGGWGYIDVSAIKSSTEDVLTKAEQSDVIALTIYEGEDVLMSWDDCSVITEAIQMYSGSYSAVATSGIDGGTAAWDSPFYSCSKEFSIYRNQITYLDLELTLQSVKVTASFSEDFDTEFASYSLTVSNGLSSLVYSSETAEKIGYFSPTGTLSYVLKVTNHNGQSYTYTKEYEQVSANQYYAFSFSIQASPETNDGMVEITIVTDDSLNEKDYTVTIVIGVDTEENGNGDNNDENQGGDGDGDGDGNGDGDDEEEEVAPSAKAVSANAWARFATLEGTYEDGVESIAIEYKEASASTWTTASVNVSMEDNSFSAELRGLSSETAYQWRVAGTSTVASFTTEAEQTVPNLNMDTWYYYNYSGSKYYYTPNESNDNKIWDTANPGSATLSVYPTTREDSNVISGYACKMTSSTILNSIFAAGNIYTGQFGSATLSGSSMGATLDLGYEFTSRPLALKGYFNYSPATIGYTKDPYTDLDGTTDVGSIIVYLTSWDEPFTVNTATSTFVDYTDSSILAYGAIDCNENSEYEEFTINLEWRDTETTPTYIVIMAASSKYGDYFTGGKGSTLYIDEMSLVYDPDELD